MTVGAVEKTKLGIRLPGWLRVCLASLVAFTSTIVGLLVVTFFIGRIMPIDPVLAVIGERASEETYQRVYHELGLDRSLVEQFINYVGDMLQGDFGISLLSGAPVASDIARVFPATIELATLGILIGAGLGIPCGVLAAAKRGSWIDGLLRVVVTIGHSIPIFWLGLVGLSLFYGKLDWVGGPGRIDFIYDGMVPTVTGMILVDTALAGEWSIFANALSHIILPAGILGYYSMTYITRMTRAFMLEQLSAEYVTTARVKGLRERAVIWNHAFRAIRVQLLTIVALSYAGLLEGSVLTEVVFSWPGLGNYITTALLAADMNAVIAGTIVVGVIFVGLNMVAELAYSLLDPRARR